MKKYWFVMPFYNPHIAGIVPFLAKSYKLHIVTFEENLRVGKEWNSIPKNISAFKIGGTSELFSVIRRMRRTDVIGFYGVLYNPKYFLFCSIASRRTQSSQIFSEGFRSFRFRRSFLLSLLPWHKISLFGIGYDSVTDYHKHIQLSKPRANYPGFAFPFDLQFPELRESPREYFSIFVGQLIQRKNVESFLDFAHGCITIDSKLKFMIVGAGPDELELKQYCQELNLQASVDWVGSASREQVLNLMSNAKSLFLNSHYEGWGAVCLEACACGTYLLIGENVRARSLIETDEIGAILEEGDLDNPMHLIAKIQGLNIRHRRLLQNHAKSFSAKSLSSVVLKDLRN